MIFPIVDCNIPIARVPYNESVQPLVPAIGFLLSVRIDKPLQCTALGAAPCDEGTGLDIRIPAQTHTALTAPAYERDGEVDIGDDSGHECRAVISELTIKVFVLCGEQVVEVMETSACN